MTDCYIARSLHIHVNVSFLQKASPNRRDGHTLQRYNKKLLLLILLITVSYLAEMDEMVVMDSLDLQDHLAGMV